MNGQKIEYLKLKVPATTANVGAGFDVFGMALEVPFDIVELEVSDSIEVVMKGKNSDGIPTDPIHNTAGIVAQELKCDVKITIHKEIPSNSGLGGSAAPAAGTAFGLNKIFDLGLSSEDLIRFAAKGEVASAGVEHADNVAPALLGGFTIVHDGRAISLNPKNIGIVAVHPNLEVNTKKAREIIPESVSLNDHIFNIGSASMMVAGIMQSDIKIIGSSMKDRVIEASRQDLIIGYKEVKAAALGSGASGVTISGSGPTVIAVCALELRENVASTMSDAFRDYGIDSKAYITTIGHGIEILGSF
ncbi:MAG: homoserine kinase [Halobacteriota archaeon]|nr:homoserine kinase [Halobacteriota archaeon]